MESKEWKGESRRESKQPHHERMRRWDENEVRDTHQT